MRWFGGKKWHTDHIIKEEEPFEKDLPHYYGDLVRRLFLAGAVLMLIALPRYWDLIPVPPTVAIFVILLVGIVAGLINPRQHWVAVLHTLVAAGATLAFEYYTIDVFARYSARHLLFWIDQALALIFLVALYYSVKTLRRMLIKWRELGLQLTYKYISIYLLGF